MISHKKYMQQALALARKGKGKTQTNPMVGCIIVKRGQIIGKGYHKEYGGPHAEAMALEQAKHKARDSIMYVTLEPCSHWGKTPPCTEKIVAAGVREVVVAMADPNPKINGCEILKLRGIKTRIGMLEDQAKKLNEGYIKYMKKRLPFVLLKAGMTVDGKIATSGGKSKYITGKDSLRMVHKLRDELGCVMVGINTILKDDPILDTRLINGGATTKVIIDTDLKISPRAKALKKPDTVIVACSDKAPSTKMRKLENMGLRLIRTKTKNKVVDMKKVMKELAKHGELSILLEGGSILNASMIREKLIDKVMLFTSPKLLGNEGISVIGNLGIKDLSSAVKIRDVNMKKIGNDMLVEGYL